MPYYRTTSITQSACKRQPNYPAWAMGASSASKANPMTQDSKEHAVQRAQRKLVPGSSGHLQGLRRRPRHSISSPARPGRCRGCPAPASPCPHPAPLPCSARPCTSQHCKNGLSVRCYLACTGLPLTSPSLGGVAPSIPCCSPMQCMVRGRCRPEAALNGFAASADKRATKEVSLRS